MPQRPRQESNPRLPTSLVGAPPLYYQVFFVGNKRKRHLLKKGRVLGTWGGKCSSSGLPALLLAQDFPLLLKHTAGLLLKKLVLAAEALDTR